MNHLAQTHASQPLIAAERYVRSLIQWEQEFRQLAAYMAANPSDEKKAKQRRPPGRRHVDMQEYLVRS